MKASNKSSLSVYDSLLILIKYLIGSNLKLFLGGIAASLMASLTGIGLLTLAAYLICSAALQPPLYTLALSITMVRACGIGRAVFRYLERLLLHNSAFSTLEAIKLSMYDRATRLLPLKEGPTYSAKLMTDLSNGSDILRDFYLRAFAPPILTLLLALIGAIMLYPIAPVTSAVLLMAWALAIAIPLFRNDSTASEANYAAYEAYRQSLIDYQLGAAELIADYQGASQPNTAYADSNAYPLKEASLTAVAPAPAFDKLFRAKLRLIKQNEQLRSQRELTTNTAVAMLHNIALVAIFAFLIAAASKGLINGIQLAVYLLAVQGIIAELNGLPDAVKYFTHAMDTIRDIEYLNNKSSISDGVSDDVIEASPILSAQTRTLLSIDSLSFTYIKGTTLIDAMSFKLQAGCHTAIIGESGCGKSTLTYLLTGLWQPDSGTINRFTKIAAGLQQHYIFSGTIRSSFQRLYEGISDSAIMEALRIACLDQAMDYPLKQNAANLSGGQRQRLIVALALAADPATHGILLLDEPTNGLDRTTALQMTEKLIAHCNKTHQTLLIITHEPEIAELMDKSIHM